VSEAEKAHAWARQAHAGQVDRAGVPYIKHAEAVAEAMNTDQEKAAAYLHDVLEDTDTTVEDLKQAGFSAEVIETVRILTRQDESYEAYIRRVAEHPLAAWIKRADLIHNMDLSRLPEVRPNDRTRTEKYRRALRQLERKHMNKELWFKKAKEKGFDGLEIYQSFLKGKEMTWYEHAMDSYTIKQSTDYSIRALIDGHIANLAAEKIDDQDADAVLDALKEQAQTVTDPDEGVIRKPLPVKQTPRHLIWKKAPSALIKQTLDDLQTKLEAYDPRIVQVSYLGYSETEAGRSIINSYGIDLSDQEEAQFLQAGIAVQEGDQVKTGDLLKIVPDLSAFDIDAFVQELADKALFRLQGQSPKSGRFPVIFEREAMTQLFAAFTGLFSGDLIYKGISPIAGKQGETIFSDQITIIDDPQEQAALSQADFDDEGCPTQKTVLVKDGVFTNMLLDSKSAKRIGAESTGNGFKAGAAISVQPMNCQIVPGTDSLEELCAKMHDGIVVTRLQGLHAGLDFVSGNFSLQCSGYLVKDGKKAQAAELMTVAGNFLDLMKRVKAVGNDLKWEYHQIIAPSIWFEECAVSGEGE
jgi:PmbA protein